MHNKEKTVNIKSGIYVSNISLLGILGLIACTIFNTSMYGASMSWIYIPCAFIVIGWAFKAMNNRIPFRREHFLFIMFWAVFFISTSINAEELKRDLITFLMLCVVLICATSVEYSKKQLAYIVRFYILVALVVELNVVYNWFTHNYYIEWFQRASFYFKGVYKDPNYVMAFILPAVAFVFIKLINEEKIFKKIINIVFLLLSVLSMFASGSRSPMLSFCVFVLIYFFLASDLNVMKKIKIILVVLFVAFVAVKVVGKYYSSQALDRLLATEDSRQDLWKSALNVFKRHPLIGGGMSAASIESLLGAGNYSHNVYLDILCNSGLAGMIIFVLYLYNSILKTDKSNRAFIYSIFVAFMLPMFFINGFNTATFYTPLILMSLMSNYCKKEEYSYLDFL